MLCEHRTMPRKIVTASCVMLLLLAAFTDGGPDMTSPRTTSPSASSGDVMSPEAGPSAEASVEIDEILTARVTRKDLKDFDYVPRKAWQGEWKLTVGAVEYVLEYTNFRVTESIAAAEDEIAITATPAPTGAFNCYDEDDVRLTGEGEASAVYSYELTDGTFELTAEEEPCELRRALLERTWTISS